MLAHRRVLHRSGHGELNAGHHRPRTTDTPPSRLALGAYQMRYFLLDIPAWPAADEAASWAPVWELVARARADAVVVHGGELCRLPKPPNQLRGLPMHLLTPDGR